MLKHVGPRYSKFFPFYSQWFFSKRSVLGARRHFRQHCSFFHYKTSRKGRILVVKLTPSQIYYLQEFAEVRTGFTLTFFWFDCRRESATNRCVVEFIVHFGASRFCFSCAPDLNLWECGWYYLHAIFTKIKKGANQIYLNLTIKWKTKKYIQQYFVGDMNACDRIMCDDKHNEVEIQSI